MNRFAYKKATQALNFFAVKQGGSSSKLKALKLMFFADRYHLRKYGRLVTDDRYFALQWGPLPSGTKDLVDSHYHQEYTQHYLNRVSEKEYRSQGAVEYRVLSAADQEALEFAWENFGNLSPSQLSKLSHEYPEWVEFADILEDEEKGRKEMDITQFIEDPISNVEPCYQLNEKEKELLRRHLQEQHEIKATLYRPPS
jgi:uncharacterized phage-associated protein